MLYIFIILHSSSSQLIAITGRISPELCFYIEKDLYQLDSHALLIELELEKDT